MKKKMLKKSLYLGLGLSVAMFTAQSCTDLEPQFTDSVPVESSSGEFTGVANVQSALDGLYNGIEGLNNQTDSYSMMEVTAENVAVLTRGADWGDNGVWRLMHNHGWNASHLHVLNAWNNRNQQVFNATQLLDPASSASADVTAQAQVLRAMNMFIVLNFYGVVPFREVNEGPDVDPRVLTAQEAYDFILADLDAAIGSGQLRNDGPGGDTFEVGQAAALFARAKVKLNAERILGAAPSNAYQDVIADVTAIENLGYDLDDSSGPFGYHSIWDRADNVEVIMHMDAGTGNRVFNMIHPNQTGWNGFVTLTETFRLHGTDDESIDARLGAPGDEVMGLAVGYLRGQQLTGDGTPLTDRPGDPLVYEDAEITSLEINNERNGIRIVKYPQRNDAGFPNDGALPNDFVFMRFAEALLMRAEAAFRSGGDGTADVNAVRLRAGATLGLGSATIQDVYDEYRREMNAESNIAGHRAVQIRFGTFADQWEVKTAQDDFRNLFPIPQNALGSNPNLVQNPGY